MSRDGNEGRKREEKDGRRKRRDERLRRGGNSDRWCASSRVGIWGIRGRKRSMVDTLRIIRRRTTKSKTVYWILEFHVCDISLDASIFVRLLDYSKLLLFAGLTTNLKMKEFSSNSKESSPKT